MSRTRGPPTSVPLSVSFGASVVVAGALSSLVTVDPGAPAAVGASIVDPGGPAAAGTPIVDSGRGAESILADADGRWAYALVFVLAAIPWLEVLVVIPPAIALGLEPTLVGAFAFLGNALAVVALVAFAGRLSRWWRGRRNPAVAEGAAGPTDSSATASADDPPRSPPRSSDPTDPNDGSARFRRARRLWDRYGLIGLSFAAPILTGVHLAAVAAVAAGATERATVGWMTVSLAVWTVVLVGASVFGLSLL